VTLFRENPPTQSELHLWERLCGRPPGWRREYATGPYRLDFFCEAAQVAVEVDGSSHDGRSAYDLARDEWHQQRGVLTLRFTVRQVMWRRRRVLKQIDAVVAERTGAPLRLPWNWRRRVARGERL
jgi:very-short-patch-repair endonuclease